MLDSNSCDQARRALQAFCTPSAVSSLVQQASQRYLRSSMIWRKATTASCINLGARHGEVKHVKADYTLRDAPRHRSAHAYMIHP